MQNSVRRILRTVTVITAVLLIGMVTDIGMIFGTKASAAVTDIDFINNRCLTPNINGLTRYDGIDGKSFKMLGRTYPRGFTVDLSYSREVKFDVSGISTLSFETGHVDNSGWENSKLTVYLDSVDDEHIAYQLELTPDMIPTPSGLIDVSGAGTVIFSFNSYNHGNGHWKDYGISGISVDNQSTCRYSSPIYNSSAEFIDSIFNKSDSVSTYNGKDIDKSFKMNGRTYHQGINVGCRYNSRMQFNVEAVKTIAFVVGHIDSSSNNDAGSLTVYCDGEKVKEVDLTYYMNIEPVVLEVGKYRTMLIELGGSGNYPTSYGIGDISVNCMGAENYSVSPVYKNAAEFMANRFAYGNCTVYDGTSTDKSFMMNGTTYYQGVVFDHRNNGWGTSSFNVETLKTVTFTVGHVDNGGTESITMTISLDGKEYRQIALSGDMVPVRIDVDVSNASLMRIEIPRGNYNHKTYALADIALTQFPKGNVNNDPDGLVNGDDLNVTIIYHITDGKTAIVVAAADIDGDGAVTGRDIVLLRRYLYNVNDPTVQPYFA